MSTYRSKLEEHIKTQYGEPIWAEVLPERIGSQNKLTRIFKNPGIADNRETIIISQVLEMPITDLMEEPYGLGTAGMSWEEKKYHLLVAALSQRA